MNTTREIDFGILPNYIFRHIHIDEKVGCPIIIDNQTVGGIHIRHGKNEGFSFVSLVGIEILEQYRNQGIATAIVCKLMSEYDCIIGAITEKSAVKFWKKMQANFFEVSKDNIPSFTKPCEILLSFYIAKERRVVEGMNSGMQQMGNKFKEDVSEYLK